ncbi:nicotinic acid mononucleotide adenylyltransferase [Thermoanaerobacterium thermosaccharolyticum]|uniref:Probable nicotinate-nucleotide adenylyltransferase n=1 Tax=Thermoanaerobacterium thermosaccharolyticum TaxID=1517 RepID=A0A231VMP8_THETR|nr:nicotinate-nucleotide adenylyltransferase [Thermoanaerobacterium thermosaccharolyticum]OXT09277.1 nicotinic acid mononucleotide adenylyltransferase [Thermoanaerobacterium thermosaccharolyticum]PHO08391.1 nicotinic acid mononucleotide adenylyltransferase [Thermoanaerobacterium thermosaccharolyticum]
MANSFIRLGIMGGTFDPIHFGHLVTAEAVRAQFNLDRVIFVPSGNPPHKVKRNITDKHIRYLMTILATVTNPYFEVSAIEIEREGYTYTIDTLKEFKKIYGDNTQIFFITGADAILEILTWKNAEELLQMCNFVAATRPGYAGDSISEKIDYIKKVYNKDIFQVTVPSLAISSTDIRNRVYEGRPIKYLLPESVERYIEKAGLYKRR